MSCELRRCFRVTPFLLGFLKLNKNDQTHQPTSYRHWHLDKTISVGHLLSTIVIAVSVFSWASAVDSRVEQNAQAVIYLTKQQQENKQEPKNKHKQNKSTQAKQQTEEDKQLQKKTEQWLRRIEDDPGGLLRNKFNYQYKRQNQQQREKDNW